jgi:hypothetical protein
MKIGIYKRIYLISSIANWFRRHPVWPEIFLDAPIRRHRVWIVPVGARIHRSMVATVWPSKGMAFNSQMDVWFWFLVGLILIFWWVDYGVMNYGWGEGLQDRGTVLKKPFPVGLWRRVGMRF